MNKAQIDYLKKKLIRMLFKEDIKKKYKLLKMII